MSTPKNHHYISQTHIKKFFDTKSNRLYFFDKRYPSQIKYKTSSKTIFSEENLNTMLVDGKYDYKSVEEHLSINFENHFNDHFKVILKFVEQKEMNINVEESLRFFAKYGALGNTRTPQYKKYEDELIYKALQPIFDNEDYIDKEFVKSIKPYGDKNS